MDDLVLDQSQVRVVLESDRPVAVRDEEGREIGVLIPHGSPADREAHLVPEVAAELVRRMSMDDIRWSTTQEVLSRLGNRDAS